MEKNTANAKIYLYSDWFAVLQCSLPSAKRNSLDESETRLYGHKEKYLDCY